MNVMPSQELSDTASDLLKSGLNAQDVLARDIEPSERAATHTPASVRGYVLPYFTIEGLMVPFYRVRLFDFEPKYKQPKENSNHVYFPRSFAAASKDKNYIIVTEGEKKAALACKLGYPCCAFGGVDSWRNRILNLPADTELSKSSKGSNIAKLQSTQIAEEFNSPLAIGLKDLMDLVIREKRHLIIVYDSDAQNGTKSDVQRAAAALAFELRFAGIPFSHIRQLVLPPYSQVGGKCSLDDFLLLQPKGSFDELLRLCLQKKSAFPRHPNIQDHLNKRLQSPHISRRDLQALSFAVLSDLDANGLRLRNVDEAQAYYFDYTTHRLYRTDFRELTQNFDSPFGQFLYKRFGIGQADQRLMVWFATHFSAEDPIENASPYRILARPKQAEDSVIYQLNDGQYARVSGTTGEVQELPGLELFDNGDNGILFEANQVTAVRPDALLEAYAKIASSPPTFQWGEVLKSVRLRDQDRQRILTGLLYYVSPWLYRWRGTQLPVEMILGEPGSGKSTLYSLRLQVITGDPKLRNAPQDIRDWYSSLSNSGALHVTDNLQFADKNLRQRISDEICRLITEPKPFIEQRKLYTNSDLFKIPVNTVFAITSIIQPFINPDILQRSHIIDLDKSQSIVNGTITYDSDWLEDQIDRYGGREYWVAHHLYVLHKFFALVKQKWSPGYKAKNRLINFEQALLFMGEVFGLDVAWIPDYLIGISAKAMTESDWALEGLSEFCAHTRIGMKSGKNIGKKFNSQEISNWAQGMPEYDKCEMLINTRRLGRYLQSHKALLASTYGLIEAGSSNNRTLYMVVPSNN